MHAITTLDVVTKTLIESCDISEIKEIKNKAESLRLYFRQQGDALVQQNRAAELKLRSESRYFCESLFWASKPKQAAKT
jgi:hypothetical protein